ncbi:hypothetical protein F5882DRAFT_525926 [Hyaloscypha sp. PMI_1271]|nr:hypothetical protein F5882DRAFT_525926 [Hyaloscypha sp. PMI_1271]
MQHLVRCIEYMYFQSSIPEHSDDNLFPDYGRYPAARRRFPGCLNEDIPGAKNATIDSFRDSFYRAMYRLLLAGAILARAYMAPLFPARQAGDIGFFVRWGSDYWTEDVDTYERDFYPTEADVDSIRQFPVYDFDVEDWSQIGQWRNREYETCFGPFASWIIEDGKSREQNEPQNPDDMPDWAQNQAHIGAVKELMLLLVAYDHFNSKFIDIRRGSRKGAYLRKQGNRTVSIVRFGIFQIEEITMPSAVEDMTDTKLFTRFHPALEGTEGKDIPYQFNVPYVMFFLQDKMRGFPVTILEKVAEYIHRLEKRNTWLTDG